MTVHERRNYITMDPLDLNKDIANIKAGLAKMDQQTREGPVGLVEEQKLRELIAIRDRDAAPQKWHPVE
jgi:hypothetical protein